MLNGVRGIGVDLCKTLRVYKLYSQFGQKYLNKALHPLEIDHFHSLSELQNNEKQIQYLATLWAVKEATIKATGKRLLFPDIQYAKNENKQPMIIFHNKAHEWFYANYNNILLSISHDDGYTIAFVMVQ